MKTILITGASSGIGKALALAAASAGYKVTACGRNQGRLEDVARQHSNIEPLAFDTSDATACKAALAGKAFDISVLNAGTCEYVDVGAFEADMFRRVFEANFFGTVNCVQALLPSLSANSQLILVDSLARLLPFTKSEAYGASKAALYYFAKSLEVDLSHKGVCVQTISPGFVETPLTEKNEFDMPMRITADEAATSMLRLIENRKPTGYFPTVFAAIIRLLGSLPPSWQRALCIKMKANGADKEEPSHEAG